MGAYQATNQYPSAGEVWGYSVTNKILLFIAELLLFLYAYQGGSDQLIMTVKKLQGRLDKLVEENELCEGDGGEV